MMAFIFGNYAAKLWNLSLASEYYFAVAAVGLLSLTNLFGAVLGKRAQNVLSVLKVIGLGGVLVAGFWWRHPGPASSWAVNSGAGSFGMAFILVLYTYGGWNDAAFVVAEIKDKQRNIPRALVLGTLLITLIYLLINSAYLMGLGFEGARQSKAIAADLLGRPLGELGSSAISLLVMISALGAVNGLIYTGSRIYSTLGEDFRLFSLLGRWDRNGRAPIWSLALQGLITVGVMTVPGTKSGREVLNDLFQSLGWTGVTWEGHGGFGTLLRCTAPIFWFFFFLSGLSLFVLRRRDQSMPRAFRVPFYPILPLTFCATCAYMFYAAAQYAGKLMLVGLIPLLVGLVLYFIARGKHAVHRLPGECGLPNPNPAHPKGSL